ncbi:hypothetical protein EC957_008974 [Mortierella hygrophila]|uniref:Uncharacterized protein n=1 Tax=Mortierella hygrophila TaxID=979708 RepID=A0A9P6JY06_9FUNG|nr:hypothetical protein EC957_008974 [Mortierella hygrophila]
MWGFIGQMISQIMLQLSPVALASTITDQSTIFHQIDWLGESTVMLLPIIERNAPLSQLFAVVLGLFMSSFVTFMTALFNQRKIPEYMHVLQFAQKQSQLQRKVRTLPNREYMSSVCAEQHCHGYPPGRRGPGSMIRDNRDQESVTTR